MGNSYSYECKKCGTRYEAGSGIGSLYPIQYKSLLEEIREGAYGAEWKKAFADTPGAALDASEFVFLCDSCGKWENGPDISLYVPKDPADAGKACPMLWSSVDRKKYRLTKRFVRNCPACGQHMRKASAKEMYTLPCPECGEKNRPENQFLWD